jgi:hypothetical protein
MNSFILIGVIFIPGFILYNFWCINNNKISIWINSKFEVTQDDYFKFQFKSSIITCLLMAIFIIIAINLNLEQKYIFFILAIFYISTYATEYIATKRNYITKNQNL